MGYNGVEMHVHIRIFEIIQKCGAIIGLGLACKRVFLVRDIVD